MRIPLILLASAALAAAALAGDSWPMFRGPHNDGHSDSTGLPLTWSETENVVWKTPIHDKGWSSPVVWGDQVWMTTAKADGTQLFAVCVDRKTGNILYDLKLYEQEKQYPAHNPGSTNSYASPTPAVEEGRVYVHFGSYGTACLDTKTGAKIWERRDLPATTGAAPPRRRSCTTTCSSSPSTATKPSTSSPSTKRTAIRSGGRTATSTTAPTTATAARRSARRPSLTSRASRNSSARPPSPPRPSTRRPATTCGWSITAA